MIEESSYIIDNDGTISLQPDFLDMIKERIVSHKPQNNHVIYLFISKEIPGIKFYNIKDSKNELEFITKRKLVFEAEWNYLINFPNKSMIFRSDIGDIRIDTYLVSEKELFRILNLIKKEDNYDSLIGFKVKIKKF